VESFDIQSELPGFSNWLQDTCGGSSSSSIGVWYCDQRLASPSCSEYVNQPLMFGTLFFGQEMCDSNCPALGDIVYCRNANGSCTAKSWDACAKGDSLVDNLTDCRSIR